MSEARDDGAVVRLAQRRPDRRAQGVGASPQPATGEAIVEGIGPRVAESADRRSTAIPRCSSPAEDAGDDALSTLLPAGAEVVVGFVDESRRIMFRRDTWIVRFRIVEGDASGRLIAWWLRVLDKRRRQVPRGAAMTTSFVAATGLRPPRDLARRRPSWWLADTQYRVRTRRVLSDVHGVERSADASYSVIEAILARVQGSPPALRERGQ